VTLGSCSSLKHREVGATPCDHLNPADKTTSGSVNRMPLVHNLKRLISHYLVFWSRKRIDLSMGPIGIQELLLILLLIGGLVFWLWILVDCAIKESVEGNTKVIWILIIVFANFIGAVVYWLVRRPQRLAELGR
jgi:Phospholipase_D-nuclease N-terminal